MSKSTSILDCKIIKLPKVRTISGDITSINNGTDAPFEVKRIFYIFDIPSGADRGAHSHKVCDQLLIAITGAFEVEIYDGKNSQTYLLNQPDKGLYIPSGIWASECNFSGSGICLVLASHEYEEADYIRNLHEYSLYKK